MKNLKQNSTDDRTYSIPDLCQTAPLLLLLLIGELTVLAWTLLDQSFSWQLFATRSLVVQWILLLSTAILCRLRRYLPSMSVQLGWLLCFAVIFLISLSTMTLGVRLVTRQWPGLWDLLQQLLAVAIISAMVLRYFQLLQQVLDHHHAELDSRMNALQARIKPHFLFNSLNTIAQLIATRPDDAELAVENLASLFRANLKETSSFCPLRQELTLVRGYLALERWRLGERLQLDWQESVHDPHWPVPVLCLQPLVENAVLHGIASMVKGGTVTVRILQTPRVTTLTVENSMATGNATHRGHGVGLANVQNRLQVLYGDQARCRVEKTRVTYKVILTLPKLKKEAGL